MVHTIESLGDPVDQYRQTNRPRRPGRFGVVAIGPSTAIALHCRFHWRTQSRLLQLSRCISSRNARDKMSKSR